MLRRMLIHGKKRRRRQKTQVERIIRVIMETVGFNLKVQSVMDGTK